MTEKVELWLGYRTPSAEIAQIEGLFREAGIDVETRVPERPLEIGNGAHWVVELAIYGSTIGAFLARYFGSAGEDAWRATKRLLSRLNDAQPPAQVPWGTLVLKHPESGAQMIIGSDLPDKALRQLFEIDFEPNTLYLWERRRWSAHKLDGGVSEPMPRRAGYGDPLGYGRLPRLRFFLRRFFRR